MIYSVLDMFYSSTSVLCLEDNQTQVFGINITCSSSSESKEIIYISCVAENHV